MGLTPQQYISNWPWIGDVVLTLREANRMSVLRKLERGQEAQAELARRFWHQNSCFQQSTLIKIACCDC